MPQFINRLRADDPSYRLHRGSGQAVVTIGGHDFYLGKHRSPDSKSKYHRLLGEWNAAGRPANWSRVTPDEITVKEVMVRYLKFAKQHYGESPEYGNVARAVGPLKELYGVTKAAQFGPLALKAVRDRLVSAGQSRKFVNQNIGRIKRLFKWACSEELVPSYVFQSLSTVSGLQKGRCAARETEPVAPVDDAIVDATLPYLQPAVADMVRLQRLTGARPGEICVLRPCDVDRSSDVWAYRPSHHKGTHRDRDRMIFIGPRAQTILAPYLLRPSESFCFSPAEVEAKRRERLHELRTTPLKYGNRPGTNRQRKPKLQPGDSYDVASYRRAIHRACVAADDAAHQKQPEIPAAQTLIPVWGPHRLRHTAATEIRRRFGIEAAANVLGHSDSFVTLVYAEADLQKAAAVMREVG